MVCSSLWSKWAAVWAGIGMSTKMYIICTDVQDVVLYTCSTTAYGRSKPKSKVLENLEPGDIDVSRTVL